MTLLIFHFIIWCLKPHKSIQMTRMEKATLRKRRGEGSLSMCLALWHLNPYHRFAVGVCDLHFPGKAEREKWLVQGYTQRPEILFLPMGPLVLTTDYSWTLHKDVRPSKVCSLALALSQGQESSPSSAPRHPVPTTSSPLLLPAVQWPGFTSRWS